jgi:hypothetical protein
MALFYQLPTLVGFFSSLLGLNMQMLSWAAHAHYYIYVQYAERSYYLIKLVWQKIIRMMVGNYKVNLKSPNIFRVGKYCWSGG